MGLLFLMVIMTTFQVFIKTIMCNVSSKSSQGLFRSVLSLYEALVLYHFIQNLHILHYFYCQE